VVIKLREMCNPSCDGLRMMGRDPRGGMASGESVGLVGLGTTWFGCVSGRISISIIWWVRRILFGPQGIWALAVPLVLPACSSVLEP
jgi:hypothetical protein